MNQEIIGHEQVMEHMTAAVRVGKISHAYVLHGEKGMGKHFLADYFAKLLQCENRSGGTGEDGAAKWMRPCGKCKSCLQAQTGNHPDIIHVTHEKNSIGVDDIRTQLNSDMGIKPYSSPYKIYIVEDADKMTEQAQNALLKTLEEPPAYGVILLLAGNINRLLPTIRSRCIALPVKEVEKEQIKEHLIRDLNVPEMTAEMAANFSAGNIGRAERYAVSDEFVQMKEEVLHFLKYRSEMELSEMMDFVKHLTQYKLQIKDCIDLMMLWFRDILVLKATGDPNRLVYRDEYTSLAAQAEKQDYESLEKALEAMDKARTRLDANVNFDTTVELMLLSMKEQT